MKVIATLILFSAAVSSLGCFSVGTQQRTDWLDEIQPRLCDFTQQEQVTVVLVGDTGTRNHFVQVGEAIATTCDGLCDFGILLGDNFYSKLWRKGPFFAGSGLFRKRFSEPLKALPDDFAFWAILGNHAFLPLSRPQAQIDRTFLPQHSTGPKWLMPAQSYFIPKLPDWLNIYVFDSSSVIAGKRQSTQSKRLESALCDKEGWKVVAGHHPAYTTGDHSKDERHEQEPLRRWLEPLLSRCGAQLYLSGHDHNQEVIDAGSYLQLVQGAGSRLRTQDTDFRLKNKAVSRGFWAAYGFAIATFERDKLSLVFYEVTLGAANNVTPPRTSELLRCSWSRPDLEAGGQGWFEENCKEEPNRPELLTAAE